MAGFILDPERNKPQFERENMNIPVPPVCWPIQYFPDGDLDNPVPGTVMAVGQWNREGQMPVLSVNFQQRNSATIQYARTVRHKDDPFLNDHAELSKFNIQ